MVKYIHLRQLYYCVSHHCSQSIDGMQKKKGKERSPVYPLLQDLVQS